MFASVIQLTLVKLAQVGISLAQIGEFAFVLLSRASNLHLIEVSNETASGFIVFKSIMYIKRFETLSGETLLASPGDNRT